MRTVPVASTPRAPYWSARALFFAIAATASVISVGGAGPLDPESTGRESKAEMIGRDRDAATFAIGDRLKITLFENLRPEAARESALASLVERPEIAGEYVVQQDGKVFLPLLGAVLVAGHTHAELGLAVDARSYAATGGGTGAQTVQLTRLPSVELGTIFAKDVSAGAIDLKKVSAKLEQPINGVLGYAFLKDTIGWR